VALPNGSAFDSGICHVCGKFGGVVDLDLVGLYQGMGIPTRDVWAYLPRLRYRSRGAALTFEEVGKALIVYLFNCRGKGDELG
jgi:hypothetical protein